MREVDLTVIRRAWSRVARRDTLGIPVHGGPFDGQRVREIVTTPTGQWVGDRTYLCQPEGQRTSRTNIPYVLRDGAYVWDPNQNQE